MINAGKLLWMRKDKEENDRKSQMTHDVGGKKQLRSPEIFGPWALCASKRGSQRGGERVRNAKDAHRVRPTERWEARMDHLVLKGQNFVEKKKRSRSGRTCRCGGGPYRWPTGKIKRQLGGHKQVGSERTCTDDRGGLGM